MVIINEVIDLARKKGKDCLIFKVDFEKAYDSVSWSFLEYMLGRLGFADKWIDWMRACVFSGKLSVLVNGSPTDEVNIQRGLKQGDPLALSYFYWLLKDWVLLLGMLFRLVNLEASRWITRMWSSHIFNMRMIHF